MQYAGKKNGINDILTFLGLLLAGSLACYILIFRGNGLEQSNYLVLFLMWVPGLSALVTVFIYKRPMKSLGWRPGKAVYLLIAYFLPILYAIIPYSMVWLTGLGELDSASLPDTRQLLVFATLGVALSMLSALGEEIGWRGYFITRLSEIMSFRKAVLLSGVVWLLWHTPLILFSDYNNPNMPVWFSWLCFATMLLGITFAFSWLRLKSCSLWPAALMHASHNLYIQGLLDPLTIDTGRTACFTGEFGVGLAIMGLLTGLFFAWLEAR